MFRQKEEENIRSRAWSRLTQGTFCLFVVEHLTGWKKIIANRLAVQTVGFKSKDQKEYEQEKMFRYLQPSDLKQFGLIPEIIGRLPVLTHLDQLDKHALRAILTEPKNALIKQYKKLFSLEEMKLSFTDEAVDMIVEKADELQLGARGLRSIMESIMLDAMYDSPDSDQDKFEVTVEYATEKLKKIDHINLKIAS